MGASLRHIFAMVFATMVLPAWAAEPPVRPGDPAELARRFAGTTISVVVEEGLQAVELLNGPVRSWEAQTGVTVDIVEFPAEQLHQRIVENHRNGFDGFDVLAVPASLFAGLLQAGVLAPLVPPVPDEDDPVVEPYAALWRSDNGRAYAVVDDGGAPILLYRRDVFEDAALRAAFRERFGHELAPPESWGEFRDVAAFLTERLAPQVYGAGFNLQPAFALFRFEERFLQIGGRFFDPATMLAQVNSPAGLAVIRAMIQEAESMPPGVQDWSSVELIQAWISGRIAMTVAPPWLAVWAERFRGSEEALAWLAGSSVVGKSAAAPLPGVGAVLGPSVGLALASSSTRRGAAELFVQWLSRPEASAGRVRSHVAVRSPFRQSHFAAEGMLPPVSPVLAKAFAVARTQASTGRRPLQLLEMERYEAALRAMLEDVWKGGDPQVLLDRLAEQWNGITDSIGTEAQRNAYLAWERSADGAR